MEKILEAVTEYRAAEADVRRLNTENALALAAQQQVRSKLSHAQDHRDMVRKAMLELLDEDL